MREIFVIQGGLQIWFVFEVNFWGFLDDTLDAF